MIRQRETQATASDIFKKGFFSMRLQGVYEYEHFGAAKKDHKHPRPIISKFEHKELVKK